MVTCPCNFGREPVETFVEQMVSKYVGSADQNLRLRQVLSQKNFDNEEIYPRIISMIRILSCDKFNDEDFALKLR